jgi:hypothetical protein
MSRQKASKAEIEQLLLDAIRALAGDRVPRVEITQADPALYGANWAATSLGGAAALPGEESSGIKDVVTALQGKYDVDWE